MNCKKFAFICSPYKKVEDIGKPVEVVRLAYPGETKFTRGGTECVVDPTRGVAYLCDASGNTFPRFIARNCLRFIDGETPEQSAEAMRLLTQIPKKDKVTA